MAKDDFKNLGFHNGGARKTDGASPGSPDEKEKATPGELRW